MICRSRGPYCFELLFHGRCTFTDVRLGPAASGAETRAPRHIWIRVFPVSFSFDLAKFGFSMLTSR